jgi:NAD(P)-dependent dehydrogenase (short-subunit alcohol dehydrogenase family)
MSASGFAVPSQAGRRAIVTGTGGLGYETALALAGAGADVILAGRNPDKGAASVAAIQRAHPGASIRFERLDLASLSSVAAFAERMLAAGAPLHLLVNNAGVMALSRRGVTEDGFELQLATNYLGHFALTARLLPRLLATPGARVISLSSLAAGMGSAIDFDDLQAERGYRPYRAYGQSKLAMLMFARELARRASVAGADLISCAAHPGFARTDLIANGPAPNPVLDWLSTHLMQPAMSQSAADGALPTLFAATSPQAQPGAYYGPGGAFELKGPPHLARVPPAALDEAAAARLWAVSEQLTGVVASL